jgi:murein DD-endopeptidase MepM/ murein hydrolase activator NlpD
MQFINDFGGLDYQKVDAMILQLPQQVRDEFKNVFASFVENEWAAMKPQLEVLKSNGSISDWVSAWNSITYVTTTVEDNLIFDNIYRATTSSSSIVSAYNAVYENGTKKAIDNYKVFTRYIGTDEFEDGYNFNYHYFTELKDNSDASYSVLRLLSKDIVIANNSVRIWQNDLLQGLNNATPNNTDARGKVQMLGADLELYVNKIVEALKGEYSTEIEETKRITQEVFGTDNVNIIKFQLYRTCKNLYDKWIGGTENTDSLIFKNLKFGDDNSSLKGSKNGRNGLDDELAIKRLGPNADPRLIDSFRFVTRAFKDIGDELLVNPKEAAEVVKNGTNNSFYDVVTSILSSNKFNFIALPNFINYNDPKELSAVFRPMSMAEGLSNGSGGPAFVCVYAGQASKNLDFKNSEYQNDGFDAQCYDGNLSPSVPEDFTRATSIENEHENNVAIFSVNYSQQNQNIFKDITLDQSEFSETAESLKITDEIASKGAENRVTLGGQNLYNVYSVRSYKAEVEMMGNAMIQPMMYFQLNNIPMFHGAYLITQVKHSIKPNYMTTIFNGVRVRNVETPLLDEAALYMPLLDSIVNAENLRSGLSAVNSNNPTGTIPNEMLVTPSGTVVSLFVDPFENSGNVVVTSVPGLRNLDGSIRTHKGVDFGLTFGTNLKSVYKGKIELLKYDAKGYGLYMVINHGTIDGRTYKSVYGHVSELNKDIFGKTLADLSQSDIQKIVSGYNPNIEVSTGTIIGKSGGAPKKTYVDFYNKKYDTAGHSTGAHLHYELRLGESNDGGTSFTQLQPIYSIPYLPLNAYCTYKNKTVAPANEKIIYGDSADYWSLMAICSLEAGVPQARADVAQSIYNRLATPGQPYGKTIKEIVVANKQYQPTFANRTDWVAINDSATAIKAIMYAKNWTMDKAKTELKNTIDALNNTNNQELARNFIQTRTEFLASDPTSTDVVGVIQREPLAQNNSFFWKYAGKKLIDKVPPLPPDWSSYNIERNVA